MHKPCVVIKYFSLNKLYKYTSFIEFHVLIKNMRRLFIDNLIETNRIYNRKCQNKPFCCYFFPSDFSFRGFFFFFEILYIDLYGCVCWNLDVFLKTCSLKFFFHFGLYRHLDHVEVTVYRASV